MKMVKSLLLGTAAGLVAIAGAQAADLPVKAKPVQYVKICSLYGAGFYYIPGTDTCLKIGGWVRLYTLYGANGNSTNGALAVGPQAYRGEPHHERLLVEGAWLHHGRRSHAERIRHYPVVFGRRVLG